jgi:hypothetical protein
MRRQNVIWFIAVVVKHVSSTSSHTETFFRFLKKNLFLDNMGNIPNAFFYSEKRKKINVILYDRPRHLLINFRVIMHLNGVQLLEMMR